MGVPAPRPAPATGRGEGSGKTMCTFLLAGAAAAVAGLKPSGLGDVAEAAAAVVFSSTAGASVPAITYT